MGWVGTDQVVSILMLTSLTGCGGQAVFSCLLPSLGHTETTASLFQKASLDYQLGV